MGQFSMQELAVLGSNFGANQQRGTLLEKRAKLMEEWGKYCGIKRDTSGKVIPLRQKRAR